MFTCVDCQEAIESDNCPAIDLRTGGSVCDPCQEYRGAWRSRLVFSENVRMSDLDTREEW